MARHLGQYSVVSYIHALRGERVNLGVLVWHPLYGCVFQSPKNLSRVRYVDESADLVRVRAAIERISEAATAWTKGEESPLYSLSREFRHGLVVTSPMNARIQDPLSTLERLSASLIPPEPFMRASSTNQFSAAFARYLVAALEQLGVSEYRSNFDEQEAPSPVRVAASYKLSSESYLWRAVSFASQNDLKKQLTIAKAVHAENAELKALQKYRGAHLSVAVQMPKPQARADWDKSVSWLKRSSEQIAVFEDRQSLEVKVPELVGV